MSPVEQDAFESATFDHVALSVGDLDAMSAFYITVFGCTVETRASFPTLGIRTALLLLPSGTRLELAERADSPSRPATVGPAEAARTRGYYHWALKVADLDAAMTTATEAGATAVVPPSDAARAGIRYGYLSDPEGNLIELVSFVGGLE